MRDTDEHVFEVVSQQEAIRKIAAHWPALRSLRSAVFDARPYEHQLTDAREYAEALERRLARAGDELARIQETLQAISEDYAETPDGARMAYERAREASMSGKAA